MKIKTIHFGNKLWVIFFFSSVIVSSCINTNQNPRSENRSEPLSPVNQHLYDTIKSSLSNSNEIGKIGRRYFSEHTDVHVNFKLSNSISDTVVHLEAGDTQIQGMISRPIIYDNNLLVLSESGQIICFYMDGFTRNIELEKILNTHKFAYIDVCNKKLFGFSWSKEILEFDNDQWMSSNSKNCNPVRRLLYEDSKVLISSYTKRWYPRSGQFFVLMKEKNNLYVGTSNKYPSSVQLHEGNIKALMTHGEIGGVYEYEFSVKDDLIEIEDSDQLRIASSLPVGYHEEGKKELDWNRLYRDDTIIPPNLPEFTITSIELDNQYYYLGEIQDQAFLFSLDSSMLNVLYSFTFNKGPYNFCYSRQFDNNSTIITYLKATSMKVGEGVYVDGVEGFLIIKEGVIYMVDLGT